MEGYTKSKKTYFQKVHRLAITCVVLYFVNLFFILVGFVLVVIGTYEIISTRLQTVSANLFIVLFAVAGCLIFVFIIISFVFWIKNRKLFLLIFRDQKSHLSEQEETREYIHENFPSFYVKCTRSAPDGITMSSASIFFLIPGRIINSIRKYSKGR